MRGGGGGGVWVWGSWGFGVCCLVLGEVDPTPLAAVTGGAGGRHPGGAFIEGGGS